MEIKYIIFAAGTVITALIGVVWSLIINRLKAAELAVINLDRRTQKIEDVQGTKLEELTKKVDVLANKFEDLANQIHKEKNIESSMNGTLIALLKYVENGYEQHEKIIKALDNLNNHYEKHVS